MSRSYKKTPWCGDHKGKIKKRMANKTVRMWCKDHPEESLRGSDYKKLHCSWDICDYGWIRTWEEYWQKCQEWHKEAIRLGWGAYLNLDEEKEYRYWCKYYRDK